MAGAHCWGDDIRKALDQAELMFDFSTLLLAFVFGLFKLVFMGVFLECYLEMIGRISFGLGVD